ncbi:hypothetical protein AB6A40_007935 [Gnathostoma spinigerum]|uniref:Pyridoxal kinase n=1 Tax=Gnathostoma spinigerum TaxID=75299 RepID=A0ABD6EPM1_9BILA
MPIYRDKIIPLASIATPNIFELSELSGRKITCEKDCLEAIKVIHEMGVPTVVVTSGLETPTVKYCFGSSITDESINPVQYRFEIPSLPGVFVGTGDVFTSLLIVWLDKLNGDLRKAIEKVIGSLQGLLKRTIAHYHKTNPNSTSPATTIDLELQLVQSRYFLLNPHVSIVSKAL